MSESLYTPPQSVVLESVLASRWKRLWASLIDGATLLAILVPIIIFTGGFSGLSEGVRPSSAYSILIGAISIAAFFFINANLLIKSGQTWGKKIVKIRIVDLNDEIPTMKKHLLKRYAAYFLPGQIPVVGQLIGLLNILMIFGNQKRCAHDYIAGTKVVEV